MVPEQGAGRLARRATGGLWCAWVLAWVSPLGAQIPVPDGPPPSGVIDDARLLDDENGALVEAEIARLREGAGISLWVVTASFVRSSEIGDWMEDRVGEWAGERAGLVLLVDRAQGQAIVEFGERLERELPYERLVAIRGGLARDGGGAVDGGRVVGATRSLVDSVLALEAEGRRGVDGLAAWALVASVLVAACVVLGSVWLAGWQGRRLRQRSGFHYFPPVVVAPRLGADFGGGCMAVVAAGGGERGREGEGQE